LKVVDAAIAAKYSHEWTTEHTFEQRLTVNCAAHTRCRILGTVPMLRYTGDLVVTMGNTTWTLRGVYFDSPSPDGAGAYEVDSRPLTAGRRASMPGAVIQTGTAGDDHLVGTDAEDLIFAGGGHDVVSGGAGHDRIYGGPGHDGILGGAGHDRIFGGAGRDRLRGGAGNDRLLGGLHRDRMVGGPGRDYVREVALHRPQGG
jgi:Ca2+-binding RTX toxin-like protein